MTRTVHFDNQARRYVLSDGEQSAFLPMETTSAQAKILAGCGEMEDFIQAVRDEENQHAIGRLRAKHEIVFPGDEERLHISWRSLAKEFFSPAYRRSLEAAHPGNSRNPNHHN